VGAQWSGQTVAALADSSAGSGQSHVGGMGFFGGGSGRILTEIVCAATPLPVPSLVCNVLFTDCALVSAAFANEELFWVEFEFVVGFVWAVSLVAVTIYVGPPWYRLTWFAESELSINCG
jgi:hypothetical protein